MAYYYVKNTGSSTTSGGTTKQTGAFSGLAAAAVYGSIADAITYGAGADDFICVSNSHSHDYSSGVEYGGPTGAVNFLQIITVDDANCDQEAATPASRQEGTGSGGLNDITFQGNLYLKNIHLESTDNYTVSNNSNVNLLAHGCTFDFDGSTDRWELGSADAAMFIFNDCTIDSTGYDVAFYMAGGGASVVMRGGTVGFTNTLINGTGQSAGMSFHAYGTNLSSIADYWLEDIGGTSGDDKVDLRFVGCKKHASLTGFVEEDFIYNNHTFLATNCGATSAEQEYQYFYSARGGVAEDETGIYRDNSTAFPSGQKISLKVTTNAKPTVGGPFYFDLPTRYAELSNAASDNIKLYILSSATLYDSDVWAEVVYPDSADASAYNYLSTRHTEILDTNGTELTTNTESWTGLGSPNENKYEISLDTSSDAGSDCYPIVRLYVAKASTTLYVCTDLELS